MRPDSPTVRPPLTLRPFGLEPCDLEVDFGARLRPRLVTEILACCTPQTGGDGASAPMQDPLARQDTLPFNRERLWDLEVGQRLAALIRVAIRPGTDALEFNLTCHNPACTRAMDLSLTLAELAEIERQAAAAGVPCAQVGEIKLTFRRPTGRDQLEWQRTHLAGGLSREEQMVRALIVEPADLFSGRQIPPEYLEAGEAALDSSDPLVNFVVQVACPDCGTTYNYAVDLQEIALGRLKLAQAQMVADVHRLACRYHWTEKEIMALPAWRRNKYLALLDREPIALP